MEISTNENNNLFIDGHLVIHKNMNKIDLYKKQVENFITKNNHEPVATEFRPENGLPSARTIQREYGGLPQFRTLLGLKTNDFTRGHNRTKKAKKSMKISVQLETELFIKLLAKHGSKLVSSPARIFLYSGKTLDFKIELNNKIYLVDVFYPTTQHSFVGCVNLKNKKYNTEEESFYTVPINTLLVCLNPKVMIPTKSKIKVISIDEFNTLMGL